MRFSVLSEFILYHDSRILPQQLFLKQRPFQKF
nr:MAG TPA: hypothetical protein [Bacteriophage sp.]